MQHPIARLLRRVTQSDEKISAEAPEEQQESRRVKPSTRKVERRKVAGGDSEARAEELRS